MKGRLNVGLLVDGYNIPAWGCKLIKQINLFSYADIIKPNWNKNLIASITVKS